MPSSTTSEAQLFDYSSAANPEQQGLIQAVPYRNFSPSFFEQPGTLISPLDLSGDIGTRYPATSPSLLASFVRIAVDDPILTTNALTTGQVLYVYRGSGETKSHGRSLQWQAGDVMALPGSGPVEHVAREDSAFYWVHDEPLLRYLGVTEVSPRFAPTLYEKAGYLNLLDEIMADPIKSKANRVSALLANSNFPETRTITQSVWTMLGILPKGDVQFPHRHESVAIDFVIDCQPGCYTMIGTELDEAGFISNGHREDWSPGASFVTPPGHWHSHHNESGAHAHVLPIQDAGLHTYLRTLEITFSHPHDDGTSHISREP